MTYYMQIKHDGRLLQTRVMTGDLPTIGDIVLVDDMSYSVIGRRWHLDGWKDRVTVAIEVAPAG